MGSAICGTGSSARPATAFTFSAMKPAYLKKPMLPMHTIAASASHTRLPPLEPAFSIPSENSHENSDIPSRIST